MVMIDEEDYVFVSKGGMHGDGWLNGWMNGKVNGG